MASQYGAVDACQEQVDAAALLYSVSLGAMAVLMLPSGYLYDRCGPRATSVIGSLLTGVALVAMSRLPRRCRSGAVSPPELSEQPCLAFGV